MRQVYCPAPSPLFCQRKQRNNPPIKAFLSPILCLLFVSCFSQIDLFHLKSKGCDFRIFAWNPSCPKLFFKHIAWISMSHLARPWACKSSIYHRVATLSLVLFHPCFWHEQPSGKCLRQNGDQLNTHIHQSHSWHTHQFQNTLQAINQQKTSVWPNVSFMILQFPVMRFPITQ